MPSKVTVANAIVPSLEICRAPSGVYGLTTALMCGSLPTFASIGAMRAWTRRIGDLALASRARRWCRLSPETAGNSAFSRLSARVESVAGSENEFAYVEPTPLLIAPMPMKTSEPQDEDEAPVPEAPVGHGGHARQAI